MSPVQHQQRTVACAYVEQVFDGSHITVHREDGVADDDRFWFRFLGQHAFKRFHIVCG